MGCVRCGCYCACFTRMPIQSTWQGCSARVEDRFSINTGMIGHRRTLGTRPNDEAQPLIDRRAMSFSRRNFVNFCTGRHRPPFIGQVQEPLALLGGRSTLREDIANARKMFVFSLIAGHGLTPPAPRIALLARTYGAYEAWGLRTRNLFYNPG
jgi:hypothetical protein